MKSMHLNLVSWTITKIIRKLYNFQDILKIVLNKLKKYISNNQYSYRFSAFGGISKKKVYVRFRYPTAKYKGKARPYSHILTTNDFYYSLSNNCVQKSIFYLKYGELSSRNIAFYDELNNSHVIPDNAIKEFRKFGKWVTYSYYS